MIQTSKRNSSIHSALNIFAFVGCIFLTAACKEENDDSLMTDPKVSPVLETIVASELETRNLNSGVDNYQNSALFLTKYDRNMNHGVAFVARIYEYADSNQFVPIVVAVCPGEDSKCGIKKIDSEKNLESISLQDVTALPEADRMTSAYDIDKANFTPGSLWIISVKKKYLPTNDLWEKIIALELTDFGPSSEKVSVRYKVLAYRILPPET